MNTTPATTLATFVSAQWEWVGAASNPQVFPVEPVRAGLIADPVTLCIPERTGLKPNHTEACARESLDQHAAGRTDADNQIIDWFVFRVKTHWHREALY